MQEAPRRRSSVASTGSILSIGSVGSVLSIGCVGSILSIGSTGSVLSIFSLSSVFSICSVMSVGGFFNYKRVVELLRTIRQVTSQNSGRGHNV